MSSVIQQISNTNLHHIHGTVVTNSGKAFRQTNVTFNVKGRKQCRLTRPQKWISYLSKLRDGFPIHLVDQAEDLSFKPVLLPTYEDYVVQVPYLDTILKWEDLELYVLPGFLGNAVCRKGKVWELYIDTSRKEWYWQEIYPNQNHCYDLINSIDGMMLEVSVDDIVYLMRSNIVGGHELTEYYTKRVVTRRTEAAFQSGVVCVAPDEIENDYQLSHAMRHQHNPDILHDTGFRPKTIAEAVISAYNRMPADKFSEWKPDMVA